MRTRIREILDELAVALLTAHTPAEVAEAVDAAETTLDAHVDGIIGRVAATAALEALHPTLGEEL